MGGGGGGRVPWGFKHMARFPEIAEAGDRLWVTDDEARLLKISTRDRCAHR